MFVFVTINVLRVLSNMLNLQKNKEHYSIAVIYFKLLQHLFFPNHKKQDAIQSACGVTEPKSNH